MKLFKRIYKIILELVLQVQEIKVCNFLYLQLKSDYEESYMRNFSNENLTYCKTEKEHYIQIMAWYV